MIDAPTIGSLRRSIGIPAYFLPGQHWDEALAAAAAVGTMVMNPATGPGPSAEATYVAQVEAARRAGVAVLGYVDTGFALRSPAAVEADIGRYLAYYPVDGVFLDQAGQTLEQLSYYEDIVGNARARGASLVAMNPGCHPRQEYVALADVLVTFEGTPSLLRQIEAPAWTAEYDCAQFWHLIYGCKREDLSEVILTSRSRRAGVVYVTDHTLDNPWDRLPTYWADEVALIGQNITDGGGRGGGGPGSPAGGGREVDLAT